MWIQMNTIWHQNGAIQRLQLLVLPDKSESTASTARTQLDKVGAKAYMDAFWQPPEHCQQPARISCVSVFAEEGKLEYPEKNPRSSVENQRKLSPHMTPGPGIEPGPRWWEASALTTMPSLLP